MRLILCEKPSVAVEFAGALGAVRHHGYFQSPDTIVTFCLGHLLRLYEPEEYDPKYRQWNVDHLPIIPEKYLHSEDDNGRRQLTTIRTLLKAGPSPIIIATDAGRVGELIARETLQWCGITDFSNVLRFWTSEALTPEAIQRNLGRLQPAENFTKLYQSGYYRDIADWLVGMNFSRFFSVRLDSVFSFGRVQIPLLAALVKRTQEIRSFIP